MSRIDLSALQAVQRQTAQKMGEKERIAEVVASHTAQLGRLERQLGEQLRSGDRQGAAATRQQIQQVTATRSTEIARLERVEAELQQVGQQMQPGDPCDADATLPLLLLPVRIETRFTTDKNRLRVRIYPDDIHIDQHDAGLDDDEHQAWQEYWSAVWKATEEQAEAAWKTLIARVGPRRAGFLALGLPPSNLAERATSPLPVFGPVSPRARRAAVARLLPDRFAVIAIQGNDRSSAIGKPVSPEVTVGLLADDHSEFSEIAGLKILKGAEWVVDYKTAEDIGMAVTVPLAKAATRVDRLVVLGVRRSLDAAQTAAELEKLMRSHRYTRGLAFVPQGTPTNNTEDDRAGWSDRTEAATPPIDALPVAPEGSNARLLADALGVDGRLFSGVPHAELREQPHARASSVAFWHATWAPFFEKLNKVDGTGSAALKDATVETTREFHRDHVRGRGPLPALRVGNQPYGLLPVSSLETGWQPAAGDKFEADLGALLKKVRVPWREALGRVDRFGGDGSVEGVLTEVLGHSPVAGSLRVRTVLSRNAAKLGEQASGADPKIQETDEWVGDLVLQKVIPNGPELLERIGSMATESRPLPLPLVDESDVKYMEDLHRRLRTPGAPRPEVASVWQALLELAWSRVKQEVEKSGGKDFAVVASKGDALPQQHREGLIAIAADADRLSSAELRIHAERADAVIFASQPRPTLAEYQPLAGTRQGFGELALDATGAAGRTFANYATSAHINALVRQAEFFEALAELKHTTVEERRLLLAETLDCASHRLDAWCTALVERRRRQRRAAAPAGLSVGAFGWVQDIDPTGDHLADGGYVHAPSLNHAATAGILRAAYLAHNAENGTGAYSIDLSSARVRTALQLIEGIRQGQPLTALLGYWIERDIHEAGLARLILSLRSIAPLLQGKLTDREENVPLEAVEALAASNVVDGVDLVEKYQGKVQGWDAARILQSLNEKPKNNPYLNGGAWPKLDVHEWQKVQRIIEAAAEACDAVGDLLMAEGVHQLVQGNTARASAALDAAGGGDSPPPEPQVITTPVETVPITHRLLLVAGAGQPWAQERPRAAAEPKLEAWAAARLGEPGKVRVHGTHTLADTGLCALDVVYDAANPVVLEQRVRAALGLGPEEELYARPHAGWSADERAFGEVAEHAAALRALLTTARPAAPDDLGRPLEPETRALSVAELIAMAERAQLAQLALGTLAAEVGTLLEADPPDEEELQASLERLAAYGVAVPMVSGEHVPMLAAAVRAEAERRVAEAEPHIEAASNALLPAEPNATVDPVGARRALVAAGQALFGEGFWMVPTIEAPPQPDLLQLALGPDGIAVGAGQIRRFLADVASVRQPVKRATDALLLTEALGEPGTLRVAQLATPGAPGTDRWVGGSLDPAAPSPQESVTHFVIDAPAGFDGAGPIAALVIDQWTDTVPLRELRGEDGSVIDERSTTGVTFNANAPSARAPQAMLLAVAPNNLRWTTDSLFAAVSETLELAQLRLVTLERTLGAARMLPATYAQSHSLQGEPAVDYGYLHGAKAVQSVISLAIKE